MQGLQIPITAVSLPKSVSSQFNPSIFSLKAMDEA